ncbi:MAG TPA: putative DNA-binding protein [Pseudogracilibacillus sp.]|nr:putative DNA-binding protein [Pseudogracilibacillus sp.]
MLTKTVRMNMLYDFYGPLLTDKQRQYVSQYYDEDYSLSEIAEKSNVSRQSVYDTIKRTEQILESYEQKLQLYAKFQQRNDLLEQIESACATCDDSDEIKQWIARLRKID